MRITIQEIMDATAAEIHAALEKHKLHFYFGNLPEGVQKPAFLLLPIYFDEKKSNLATSRKTLELQLIYFGRTNGSGRERYMERMEILEGLDRFLSGFTLQVSDRWLHFDCESREADGHLALYLRFQFLDEAYEQEESKTAESVALRLRAEGS